MYDEIYVRYQRYTSKWRIGTKIFDNQLPPTAPIRREDYIKSGIVEQFVSKATSAVLCILGGKPGDYNIVEGARQYPYGKLCVNPRGPNS